MNYRGYDIDDKVSYDEKNRKYIRIGFYKVVEVKKGFVGVYSQWNELITHCKRWNRATKIAKILLDTYCDGYERAREDYDC